MIRNIEKYASTRGISRQDALQTFLQVIVLKNIHLKDAKLIGGTALVMGHNNPRFSEDIDLTGVSAPQALATHLKRAPNEISGLLGSEVKLIPPKTGRVTWRISCRMETGSSVKLHIDSQPYPAFSHFPLMIEYPGIPPFVFPSIDLKELMAEKISALVTRRNISGRDVFDLWYHWLKNPADSEIEKNIVIYLKKKLVMRNFNEKEFIKNAHNRLDETIPKRVIEEWERYLPKGFKNNELYEQIYRTVRQKLSMIEL